MELETQLASYGRLLVNEPLKRHTTYRIGGPVRYFLYPESVLDLMEAIRLLEREGIPWHVIGKGSNVLAPDTCFDGAVLCLDRGFSSFWFQEDGTLVAQAGASLVFLAHEAARLGFSGLEFASGIPGTVGGGLYMNAGAYREDLAGILEEVLVYRRGRLEWVPKEQLDYAYRHSAFQSHPDWLIVAGRFRLQPADPNQIRSLMQNRQQRRLATQPLNMPSAGSVFRNPEGRYAWQLIDDLGFRGRKSGGAQVSDKHSNFIVNTGEATSEDVLTLIRDIQQAVKEAYGLDLVTEVEPLQWES